MKIAKAKLEEFKNTKNVNTVILRQLQMLRENKGMFKELQEEVGTD